MNKKELSETDIRTKFSTPALVPPAGKWDLMTQLRKEVYFTKGQGFARGFIARRARARGASGSLLLFLNNQQPMTHPKKSGQGYLDRYRLLESHFGPVIADLRSQVPRRDAADDDLLDALVALWSAQRVRAGSHVCLPADPPRDRFGLRIEMVA